LPRAPVNILPNDRTSIEGPLPPSDIILYPLEIRAHVLEQEVKVFTNAIQADIKVIMTQAETHGFNSSKYLGLDADYLDLLPRLFKNIPKEVRRSIPYTRVIDKVQDTLVCITQITETYCNANVKRELEHN